MLVHQSIPLDLVQLYPTDIKTVTHLVGLAIYTLQMHYETDHPPETIAETVDRFINPQIPRRDFLKLVEYIHSLLPRRVDMLFHVCSGGNASYIYFDTLERS